MKICSPRLSAIVAGALCAFCAGAGIAQTDADKRAADLRVYAFGEIGIGGYEVVSRLWADSWRSAFRLASVPTREQAMAALQAEASRRGADGLLNVSCFDQSPGRLTSRDEPAYLCSGVAIRVLPTKG